MMGLTNGQLVLLAKGVTNGVATIRMAAEIGADRDVLRHALTQGPLMGMMAKALGSPDELGENGIVLLLTKGKIPDERIDNTPLRLAFAEVMRGEYPDWFRKREARMAARVLQNAAEERRQAELEARRERRAARIKAQHDECRRADYWNLQTLVELQRREWENGTPDELRRGLHTADERECRRRKCGITWGCVGFGIYYAETWCAARCALTYDTPDWQSFSARHDAPQYAKAWCEIEAEQSEKVQAAYNANPLRRRDPKLPTTETEARALREKLRRALPTS